MEKHVWAGQEGETPPGNKKIGQMEARHSLRSEDITLFLAGDVMTGRGIDQVLPHPADPVIYEPYMRSASGYVELAELKNGPIPKPVDNSYIWGDALTVLDAIKPDLRIINLETSVTKSDDYWPDKGINYGCIPGISAASPPPASIAACWPTITSLTGDMQVLWRRSLS